MEKNKSICNNAVFYPTMMTIAGSDSIGGAGIQADIKTASALGVYAMSVITAVTAQNTCHVASYQTISGDLIARQIDTVCEDVMPDAIKTGMIPTADAIHAIAVAIKKWNIKNIVVDPVAVATSRDRLSDDSAINAIVSEIFPLADIITPNVSEASLYTGLTQVQVKSSPAEAARMLLQMGPKYVLIKGGDTPDGDKICDCLFGFDGSCVDFRHQRINTVNTHGTGCSLSSAIASFLALGYSIDNAVSEAEQFIIRAIYAGSKIKFGNGHGPINHLINLQCEHYKTSK